MESLIRVNNDETQPLCHEVESSKILKLEVFSSKIKLPQPIKLTIKNVIMSKVNN